MRVFGVSAAVVVLLAAAAARAAQPEREQASSSVTGMTEELVISEPAKPAKPLVNSPQWPWPKLAPGAEPGRYEASALTIGPAEFSVDQELVAKPGQPLATGPFWTESAARLIDSASREVILASDLLAAGKTLSGMNTPVGLIYCSPQTSIGHVHCLQDMNNDGVFDSIRAQVGDLDKGTLAGMITEDGRFNTLRLGPAKPLKSGVRYTIIPQEEGPRGRYSIRWQLREADIEGRVHLLVWSTLSGQLVAHPPLDVRLTPGTATEMDYHGTRATVLGIAEDGSLRYVVHAIAQNETVNPVMDTPVYVPPIILYLPIPGQ